ncbi:MAG: hypothetical protein M0Z54_07970 [Thermaerobacter sp.]|nr:hypothetical protein [Thermaerobacter sp.]
MVVTVLAQGSGEPVGVPAPLDALAAEGFPVVHVRLGSTVRVEWPLEPVRHSQDALTAFARFAQEAVWPSVLSSLIVPDGRLFAAYVPAVWIGSDGAQVQWPMLGLGLLLAALAPPPWLVLTERAVPAPLVAEPRIVAHRLQCLTERLGWTVEGSRPPVSAATVRWGRGTVVVVGRAPAPEFVDELAHRLAPTPVVASEVVHPSGRDPLPVNLAVWPEDELERAWPAAWGAVVPPGDRAPAWVTSLVPQVGGDQPDAWPAVTPNEYERGMALATYARAHQTPLDDAHPVSQALAQLLAQRCERPS